jgi:hypothetical protein
MKLIVFSLLICVLSGCVVQKVNLYRATNESGRYENRYQGLLNTSYGTLLKGKNSVALSGWAKNNNEFDLFFQISVAKGSVVKLDSWQVTLSSPEFHEELSVPIGKLSVSIYGREGKAGYYRYIEPGDIIKGEAVNEKIDNTVNDAFVKTISVKQKAPAKLFVKLPDFIVDGLSVSIPAIEFDLIESYNYVHSLQ